MADKEEAERPRETAQGESGAAAPVVRSGVNFCTPRKIVPKQNNQARAPRLFPPSY